MRLLAILLLFASAAHAQFPSKPIRVLVPFGAGSSTDTVIRIIAQPLGQALGQPVVVENKPGADGAISAVEVAKAPADGHTLLFATNSPLSATPHLKKKIPYDPIADFTPITFVGNYTFFAVVNPSVPAKTLAELVAYAQANPDKLNYGTGNTSAIVMTATFASLTKTRMVHVPYKSEPPAVTDLVSGNVQFMFSSYTTIAPHIQSGRLRVLATTLPERSPLIPDAPTLVEAGLPKLPIASWAGLLGPAKLPKDITDRLNREVNAILKRPETLEALNKQAFAARGSTAEEFAAYTKDQLEIWGKAIRDAGIQPE